MEVAHALQHQGVLAGVEGHEHGGIGLVVGQHGHVLDLGRGLQRSLGGLQLVVQHGQLALAALAQVLVRPQPHGHGRHGGAGAQHGGAAPPGQGAPHGGFRAPGHARRIVGAPPVRLGGAGLFGLQQVVDTDPDRIVRAYGRLHFGQGRPAALPQQGGGAHRGLVTGQLLEAAARRAPQRAQGVSGGQPVQQFGVSGNIHGKSFGRSEHVNCFTHGVTGSGAAAPGRAVSRS